MILLNNQFLPNLYKYYVPIKKKKDKRSPLSKYSSVMDVGINNSTKSQKRKIAEVEPKLKNIDYELEQVPLVDLYMRVDNKWVHKGKSCGLCQILMNDKTVIAKHRYVCKVLNRKVWELNNADP